MGACRADPSCEYGCWLPSSRAAWSASPRASWCCCRFLRREPDSLALPAATLAVNVLGSFALGAVVGWLRDGRPLVRAFLGAGVLGGFTTYSSFAVQTAVLVGTSPVAGVLLAVGSVAAGLAAATLGFYVTRPPRHSSGGADAEPTS